MNSLSSRCLHCGWAQDDAPGQRHLTARVCDDAPDEEPRYLCFSVAIAPEMVAAVRDIDRALDALCVRVRSGRGDAGVDFVRAS